MAFLLPTLIALCATALFAAVSIRALRSARARVKTIVVSAAAEAETRRAVRGAQGRMLLALVLGLLAAIVVAFIPVRWYGLGMMLAASIGALVACGLIALLPFPTSRRVANVRMADLAPRTMGMFGPRWGFILPLVSAVFLIAFLVATGMTASGENGGMPREVAVVSSHGYHTAGPYPGWFYGLPLIVVTVMVAIVVLAALHRIAGARGLDTPERRPLDGELRRVLTRFVMLLSATAVIFSLGATMLEAGSALRSAAQWAELKASIASLMNAGVDPSFFPPGNSLVLGVVQPQYTVGAIGAVVGLVLIAGALTLAILAIASIRIRWSVFAPSEPEKVDA
jgi:hypothetical protein